MSESTSDKKRPGAGFVIVRKFDDGWKVLGLRLYGRYDIPKGGIEHRDAGNRFLTAQRECYEECDISVSPENLLWGNEPLRLAHLTIFLAATEQDPTIKLNSKLQIYEHHGAEWLEWEAMESMAYGYLQPAITWAKQKVNAGDQ